MIAQLSNNIKSSSTTMTDMQPGDLAVTIDDRYPHYINQIVIKLGTTENFRIQSLSKPSI